jgi:hypothetical protein
VAVEVEIAHVSRETAMPGPIKEGAMKRQILGMMVLLTLLGGIAGAQSPPQPRLGLQIFTGGLFLAGDSDNWSGALTLQDGRKKSSCVLTITSNPNNISNGVGPNGSLLFTASGKACSGNYQLFLSGGTAQFSLPFSSTQTGVYTGTFTIVSATDGQTVSWAGPYTQVYNLNPVGFGCGNLTFCSNLGPQFGSETFNGSGLAFVLELNALFIPRQ